MRSRLWLLILRELPSPLRWLGTEIVRTVDWIDRSTARLIRGLREAPAWYFVTSIGTFAVFLTVLLFISLIDETSGHRPQRSARRSMTNLSRQDLEKNNEWSVQDRWRVAHLFVMDKPSPKANDLQIDSRLMASKSTTRSTRQSHDSSLRRNSPTHFTASVNGPDVRLELSRPKKAQQGNRIVAGTVIDTDADTVDFQKGNRTRARDPRLLVQAAWEFGAECNQYDYASRPVRRPVLVPRPEPEPKRERELPPVIVRRELPDLSFEMDMVRRFSVAGTLPPGSHLVTRTDHSTYPEHEIRFPSELVSHEVSPWKRFKSVYDHLPADTIAYRGFGIYDPSHVSHAARDEFDQSLRAVADVALRLKLNSPESVGAGKPHQSRLLVSNDGQDLISQIEVVEFLSGLQTVVNADPPGSLGSGLDPETGMSADLLHREIQNLSPGEAQEMSLVWVPEGNSRQLHRARVIAHAEVSTSTDVIAPDPVQQMPSVPPERVARHSALVCDLQYLDRVHVGKDIELEITVRNTGNTTLHGVKVEIKVAGELSHRDGDAVVFDAGNLPVNGRNRTVLKFAALHAGEAVSLVHVDAEEPVKADGRTVIQVVERRKAKEPKLTPSPRMNRESVPPAPPLRQLPAKDLPVGECCCQKLTFQQYRLEDLNP